MTRSLSQGSSKRSSRHEHRPKPSLMYAPHAQTEHRNNGQDTRRLTLCQPHCAKTASDRPRPLSAAGQTTRREGSIAIAGVGSVGAGSPQDRPSQTNPTPEHARRRVPAPPSLEGMRLQPAYFFFPALLCLCSAFFLPIFLLLGQPVTLIGVD